MTQNYNIMVAMANNIVIDESAELQREVERDHPRKLSLRHSARKDGHTAGQPFPTLFLTVRDSHLSHKPYFGITPCVHAPVIFYYYSISKGEMIYEKWLWYSTVPVYK